MKFIRTLGLYINILFFQQCSSQPILNNNKIKDLDILTQIFENNDGFSAYCDQLDSIFYSLFFCVPCDFIDQLDKTNYNILKIRADSFDLVTPQVTDGSFNFKCDPRLFEYLTFSCKYYGQSPEKRMRNILGSMLEYENSEEKEMIQSQNVNFWVNMKLISEDSILNIYEEIKSSFYLQSRFINNLKISNNFDKKYITYLEYFLLTNRDNHKNYKYILQYFLNVNSNHKEDKDRILTNEKLFLLSKSNDLNFDQVKLIAYIDHFISKSNNEN